MKTVTSENVQTAPKSTAITTVDMVAWWTKNNDGNFDWALYRKIVDAKRFLDDNPSD